MNEITITNTNGVLTVSSLQVAKDFGKQHKDVIKSIENLLKETSAKNFANLTAENSTVNRFFIESTYADSYGRCQKCYDITRDGFSLLVMGFTGKKALEWKLKYIEAFNSMERQLININSDIEEIVSKVLNEKIENVVNRVFDEKMNSVIKAVKETVEKTSYETVNTLIPCFLYTHKKLKKLHKKLKNK